MLPKQEKVTSNFTFIGPAGVQSVFLYFIFEVEGLALKRVMNHRNCYSRCEDAILACENLSKLYPDMKFTYLTLSPQVENICFISNVTWEPV